MKKFASISGSGKAPLIFPDAINPPSQYPISPLVPNSTPEDFPSMLILIGVVVLFIVTFDPSLVYTKATWPGLSLFLLVSITEITSAFSPRKGIG